ncbi:MAG TPA: hypothetical protein VFC63_20005 [Blastocatellia bacterium]|nr:hypothetical protein [Blastocatellia bacterium]
MRKLILALFVLAGLTGCRLFHSNVDGAHAKNLFSRTEIENILSAKVTAAQLLSDTAAGSVLRFSIGDDQSELVQITVTRPALFPVKSNAKSSLHGVRSATTIKKTVTVDGIGDEAYWDGDTIHFVKNDCYVTIHFESKNMPVSLKKAKKLAELAASRI